MSKNIYLSNERYLAALIRFRERVKTVGKEAIDITGSGIKSTTCSWGLCEDKKEAWPDPKDTLWPDQYHKRHDAATLYRQTHQKCPLDRRTDEELTMNGCFYTCRVFNPKKDDEKLTREFVVKLYNIEIGKRNET